MNRKKPLNFAKQCENPLLQRATQIAVVHNHPSGNIQPSQPDRTLTEHIRRAADTMNIRLIDHVIVCEDKFYSFADEGLL